MESTGLGYVFPTRDMPGIDQSFYVVLNQTGALPEANLCLGYSSQVLRTQSSSNPKACSAPPSERQKL